MAQDVALWGVVYTDTPTIQVPKSGGGMAAFHDVTDTTAAAADVAQGKLFHAADGTLTEGTASGGGGSITVDPLNVTQNGTYTAESGHAYSPVTVNVSGGGGSGNMSDPIRFFDYDGTLVASYTAVPSALPSVPTHTGLTNGTWNYTLAQVTTQFNAMGTCDVGANYDTVSGATEIDCEFVDGRLSPYLRFSVNGTVTVDWGDGSATDTVTGTVLTERKNIQHTYAAAGKYTIKLTPASGTTYAMYDNVGSYALLNANKTTTGSASVYASGIERIRVGAGCSINSSAFSNCYNLQSVSIPSGATGTFGTAFKYCVALSFVSIPSGVTSVGSNAFDYAYGLKVVSFPSGVTSIGGYAFRGDKALQPPSIPSGVTSISSYMFYDCNGLQTIAIPSGVTEVKSYAFYNCHGIAKLLFGSSLTKIESYAFYNCVGMKEYHFASTTPPTLANTNAFNNIPSDCVIYVPRSENQTVLNSYKTADKWSTYASYMQEEPA